METINQQSFDQVAFAQTLHEGIHRLTKAVRAEQSLTQRLEEAKKERGLAGDFIAEKLMPLSDDELKILKANFPDVAKFIDYMLESQPETVSENGEADK